MLWQKKLELDTETKELKDEISKKKCIRSNSFILRTERLSKVRTDGKGKKLQKELKQQWKKLQMD